MEKATLLSLTPVINMFKLHYPLRFCSELDLCYIWIISFKSRITYLLNGDMMKNLQEKIADVSSYLQSLLSPNVFPKVQEAVEKKDKTMLIKVCKNAEIPDSYLSSIVPIILSVGPNQKWPEFI